MLFCLNFLVAPFGDLRGISQSNQTLVTIEFSLGAAAASQSHSAGIDQQVAAQQDVLRSVQVDAAVVAVRNDVSAGRAFGVLVGAATAVAAIGGA